MSDQPSGGGGYGPPRTMHDATCAQCSKKTQVPFQPSAGRPVFCRDCYAKRPATAAFGAAPRRTGSYGGRAPIGSRR